MSKKYSARENKAVYTIIIEDWKLLPSNLMSILLGFSVGDSQTSTSMEIELPNDTESDQEVIETILDILKENGYRG